MDLRGKVALVTGGGSGIGAAAAELFGRLGARVGVLSRTPEEVHHVVERIARAGGEAMAFHADVSRPDQIESCTRELVRAYGALHVVFANAGINGVRATIEETSVADFDELVENNLRGTFLTCKAATPHLKRAGRGSIIITSSINGTRTFDDPGSLVYSTTKAGLVAMAKMLAIELAQHHIRVNAVCPGSIDTEIEENTDRRNPARAAPRVEFPEGEIPLTRGEPGTPEHVAQLVAFLASDLAEHITGAEIVIDGGQSLIV